MRKILIIALVALCATFQGEVCAENSNVSTFQTSTHQVGTFAFQNAEVNDIQLEWILNQVVDQTGMTYNEVRSLYDAGELIIEKVGEGYEVTFSSDAEGGLSTILIASDL